MLRLLELSESVRHNCFEHFTKICECHKLIQIFLLWGALLGDQLSFRIFLTFRRIVDKYAMPAYLTLPVVAGCEPENDSWECCGGHHVLQKHFSPARQAAHGDHMQGYDHYPLHLHIYSLTCIYRGDPPTLALHMDQFWKLSCLVEDDQNSSADDVHAWKQQNMCGYGKVHCSPKADIDWKHNRRMMKIIWVWQSVATQRWEIREITCFWCCQGTQHLERAQDSWDLEILTHALQQTLLQHPYTKSIMHPISYKSCQNVYFQIEN